MEETQMAGLCRQLHTVDTSLGFLALVILSVFLSWRGTVIQRQGLWEVIQEKRETVPDVFPLRLTAGALVIGALTFFFGLALDTWEESRDQDAAARRSAQLNLWASLLVLAAALIRLYDLTSVQRAQPALEEELLPE